MVVGDFILDVYLQGNCTRLAPEAPVPVVDVIQKKYCLGGAANAAANLIGMGAQVFFCTVMGKDDASAQAEKLFNEIGLSGDYVVSDTERSTIVKTRVTAPSHTLVRYDEGTETGLHLAAETKLITCLHQAYFECDAVLVADYDKGILTSTVISELKKLKLMEDKFIAVDSKRAEVFVQITPSLLKPNYEEAIKLLSLPYTHQARIEQLKPYGGHFQQKTNAVLIALTLDEDGAMFFKDGEFVHHELASKVNEPHVSGAGDTFIAALLLSLVSGATLPVAAEIAAVAASIAISRKDTAICTNKEMVEQFGRGEKVIHMTSQLKDRCKQLSAEGKRLIFTNGCFDILHSGHVNYLRQAKDMGDVLIVGLNNDESIRRLKGKERPVNTLENRVEVLSALACVDYVVPFGSIRDDTPLNLIKIIRPDVFVKGGDYKHKHLPEEKMLRRMGCQIAFIPFVYNQSTTKLIEKVRSDGHLKIAVAN